jgi:PAS domain S-box-containing protein
LSRRLSSIWLKQLKTAIRNPHFWVILTILVLCTIHHYANEIGLPEVLFPDLLFGLTRHAADRVLYLISIIYAGYIFGTTIGLATTFVTLLIMLPRAIFISPTPHDALFEITTVILVGVLANLWFRTRAKQIKAVKEREQATAAMVIAQERLSSQIRNTIKCEKKLTSLSNISNLLTQSLETKSSLRSAMDMVMEVMGVEVVLLFSIEEKTKELILTAYAGVSPEFAQSIGRMRLGEGFNGRVAETEEPLLVEDASEDPGLSREAVRQENLQAQLIVPMRAGGRVVGTLCVAMRQQREFNVEDVKLLTAIGSETGIAIENARLYQEQLGITEQLRQSEKNYRELFESAHDAIWVHDLEGNILVANKATETLTGFSIDELSSMNVKHFLSPESLKIAEEVHDHLLQGEAITQPYEQHLLRRDGTEATLRLTTNLISSDGQPTAFQNIARDITEEKRMEENLRFYVQQITKAQEEERLRISRELHDSTAQTLIALLHQLENLLYDKAKLPVGEARELWDFHEQIKGILQEVRHLSRDLRPSLIDDVGLLAALRWALRELKTEHSVDGNLQVRGDEQRLSQEVELILFRIVQEALRNIGKHSHASKAEVLISFEEGKFTATINDNGIGFQLPDKVGDLSRSGKLGLVGMQERVRLLDGSLEIKSEPGKGTTIIVEAPI